MSCESNSSKVATQVCRIAGAQFAVDLQPIAAPPLRPQLGLQRMHGGKRVLRSQGGAFVRAWR